PSCRTRDRSRGPELWRAPRSRRRPGDAWARASQRGSDDPDAPDHECDARILRRRQSEIARVHVAEIAGTKEVEQEAARSVQQRDDAEEPPLKLGAVAQHVDDQGDRGEDQGVIQAQVVAGTAGEVHGEEEVRRNAGVIVDGEATEPRDRPPRRQRDRERVGVRREAEPAVAQVQDARDQAAEDAARGRKAVPELEQLQRTVLAQLLGVVREDVDEVRADQSTEERPAGELLHRLGIETAAARRSDEEPRRQPHPRRRENAEGLDGHRPEVERRNHEVGNQTAPSGAAAARCRPFQTRYSAGYTTSSSRAEVTTPPTIGAAMRFITSAPVPVDQSTGRRPARMVATVIIFGRMRLTAPATTASRASSRVRGLPSFQARSRYSSITMPVSASRPASAMSPTHTATLML